MACFISPWELPDTKCRAIAAAYPSMPCNLSFHCSSPDYLIPLQGLGMVCAEVVSWIQVIMLSNFWSK